MEKQNPIAPPHLSSPSGKAPVGSPKRELLAASRSTESLPTEMSTEPSTESLPTEMSTEPSTESLPTESLPAESQPAEPRPGASPVVDSRAEEPQLLAIDQAAFSIAPATLRANRLAARSEETHRALQKNWRLYASWRKAQGLPLLPADADATETFLLYLAEHHPLQRGGGCGMKPSAVEQALWALNLLHRVHGYEAPGKLPQVRTALAGIRRRKGMRQKQQAPLSIAEIALAPLPHGLRGLRDRALLLVGFAGCLRRSELVALRVEDFQASSHGLRVLIRRSKNDPEGRGSWVDLVRAERNPACCPVRSLEDWWRASSIREGYAFRAVGKGERVRESLSAGAVDAIVKRVAASLGFDSSLYGGHSLRAGRATFLADHGVTPVIVARHGRWKSLDMVLRYYRGETARALSGLY